MTKAGGSRCKLLLEVTEAVAEEEIQEATVSLAEAEEKVIRTNMDVFYFRMRKGENNDVEDFSLSGVTLLTSRRPRIANTLQQRCDRQKFQPITIYEFVLNGLPLSGVL